MWSLQSGLHARERGGLPFSRQLGALALFCLVLVAPGAWANDLPVSRGDVISVSVLEDPAIDREAKVSNAGTVALPRLGSVEVTGMTVDQVRERIEILLRERQIVREPNVLVEIAQYRPFYVGGSVTTPGAITYEPGLTVRHALILAGGLEITEKAAAGGADPLQMAARLRGLQSERFALQSLIDQLKADLANTPAPDAQAPASQAFAKEIAALDGAIRANIRTNQASEDVHRESVIKLLEEEIEVLEKQAVLQQEQLDRQDEQVATATNLVERGIIPLPRLQGLVRERSSLSISFLDNQAFSARARQNRADAEHQKRVAAVNRRIETQRELRTASLQLVQLDAEIDALSAALVTAGVEIAQAAGVVEKEPRVQIFRQSSEGEQMLQARMDTPVLPGDILEVSLVAAATQ
ncbi:MAG: polysaccharide biosynthesis/export family protein [Pseudomonadota bacterium]